jgi:hypothetical protein
MKPLAIALVIVALAGTTALAQYGGYIAPFYDAAGTCCIMYENVGAVNTVYFVHTDVAEAEAARFMVMNNWLNAIVLGPGVYAGPYTGNIFTGITVGYGGCQPLPVVVAAIDFYVASPSFTSEYLLPVVPDPAAASGNIEVSDCADTVHFAYGGHMYIGIDYIPMGCLGCLTVSAQENTWGKIKAMYR